MALFEVGHIWQNEEGSEGLEPVEYLAVAGLLVGPLLPSGWQRDTTIPAADFGTVRGVVERLCEGLGIGRVEITPLGDRAASLPQFHPGRTGTVHLGGVEPAGVVGEIHPRVAATLRLRERVYVFELSIEALHAALPAEGPRFQPISNKPAVSRDLAPRVAESVPYAEIEAAVRATEAPNLESFSLTDVFRGEPLPESVKSLTLAFTFRSQERTLSDAEVNDALARIRAELETRCGATFVA
jgi:phenylalanyl-tRNA synthetase beta chain